MTGYARLVLTGRSLAGVGGAIDLARALQPSIVVLEDVDLVVEDRSIGPGSSLLSHGQLSPVGGCRWQWKREGPDRGAVLAEHIQELALGIRQLGSAGQQFSRGRWIHATADDVRAARRRLAR